MEENTVPRASSRSCHVLNANIRGLHKNLSLIARGGDMVLCSKTLVSFRRYVSELMILGFGRQMQLLRGEVVQFRGLAV